MAHSRHHFVSVFAVAVIVLIAFGIPAGYMGAYYAMLDRSVLGQLSLYHGDPLYKTESEFVDQLFHPAHRLDQILRPDSHFSSLEEELRFLEWQLAMERRTRTYSFGGFEEPRKIELTLRQTESCPEDVPDPDGCQPR